MPLCSNYGESSEESKIEYKSQLSIFAFPKSALDALIFDFYKMNYSTYDSSRTLSSECLAFNNKMKRPFQKI